MAEDDCRHRLNALSRSPAVPLVRGSGIQVPGGPSIQLPGPVSARRDYHRLTHLDETQTTGLAERARASASTPLNQTSASAGISAHHQIAGRHLDSLRDAYLLWPVQQLDRERIGLPRAMAKIYPIDPIIGRLAYLRSASRADLDLTVLAESQTGMALQRAHPAGGAGRAGQKQRSTSALRLAAMTGRELSCNRWRLTPAHGRSRYRVPARENADMAYQLQILSVIAGTEPAELAAAADAAIAASGSRERVVEVRMSAGPTVRINPAGQGGYEAAVSRGAQHGNLTARAVEAAIECADRLACAFYQMRDAKLVQD